MSMHTVPSSTVVIGTVSRQGQQWLSHRFDRTSRPNATFLFHLLGTELDSVLWAEELRADAHRAGFRLSIGICEHTPGITPADASEAANIACRRAQDLGGDITVSHSALLAAA